MTTNFNIQYSTAIFKGKLLHGIQTWGGMPETTLNTIQKIQDIATKAIIGYKYPRASNTERLKHMKWMTVKQEIDLATLNFTHKVISHNNPAELSELMPLNTKGLRMTTQRKLHTKPKILNINDKLENSFRSISYLYNTLPSQPTTITDHSNKKKNLTRYMNDKSLPPQKSKPE